MVRTTEEFELSDISHHFEVLRGICHAFASSTDLVEATASTVRWVQAAIRDPDRRVRVFMPAQGGQLRLADAGGDRQSEVEGGADLTRARTRVFHSRTGQVFDPEGSLSSVALLPLVSRGEALGLLEVEGRGSELLYCWKTLEAVASQAAMALRNARRGGSSKEAPARDDDRLNFGIAVTAHELRTPLLGAKAAVEQLAGKESSSDDSRVLRRVTRELDQLAQLVDLLLRWSVGTGAIDLRPADLVSVVREAVFSCGQEDADRVRVSAPDMVPIRVDPRHIRSAIANVIANALVYSPADRAVEVEIGHEDSWAFVTVIDQGPGVQASEVDSIFDPFTRGAAAGRRDGSGAGLGLFIARKVINAHAGRISVQPNGSGATFFIELPANEETT